MENMGKTPAFKVWITNAIKLGVSEINMSDFEIINQTKNVGDSINMNAGSEYSYEALSTQRGAVSIIDSVNIKTGKKAFYCLGIIKYIDIFGDKRFTRYCFKYDPGTGIFRSYGSYNNAN
jgi:hypothetical protein